MRIAHIVSPNYMFTDFYGGTEAIVMALAKEQMKEGHDVYVFSGECGTPNFNDSHLISFSPVSSHRVWPVSWILDRMTGARHMYKSCKFVDAPFDVVHNHLSEEGIALSFLSKVPCLTTLHGIAHMKFPQSFVTKFFATTRRTKLVAISRSGYIGFKRFYGDDLIGYVYHGLDLSRFPFIASPVKQHELQLCSFGRIAPEKGIVEAIKITDILHERGVDVELRITAKYDARNRSYFRKVLLLSSRRPYVFLKLNATFEEMVQQIGNSDAFLFPVQCEEPFGLAMIESMAYGTPVIAFARGAAKEVIKHNITGILCENLDDMVNAAYMVANIDRKNCRRRVEELFNLKSMSLQYLRIYGEVIASNT